MHLNPDTDVTLTTGILALAPGRRSSNATLNAVADACLWRLLQHPFWPTGLVEVKSSRHPELMAGHMMSEVHAAERTPSIFFVSAVISVRAGDDLQPGMTCRFFGWDWRPYFLRAGKQTLRRYHNQHATIEMPKSLASPITKLRQEADRFLHEFHRRTGRIWHHNEPPPEWLEEFAAKRLGIWGEQGDLLSA